MLKKRVLLGVAGGIFVAGLAGCASGPREPSKREYVSKLNAMCADFSAREQKIGEPHTLADLVDKGPRILDAFEKRSPTRSEPLRPQTRSPIRRIA